MSYYSLLVAQASSIISYNMKREIPTVSYAKLSRLAKKLDKKPEVIEFLKKIDDGVIKVEEQQQLDSLIRIWLLSLLVEILAFPLAVVALPEIVLIVFAVAVLLNLIFIFAYVTKHDHLTNLREQIEKKVGIAQDVAYLK